MVVELAVWISVLFLKYWVYAFVAICAVCFARSVIRWRTSEERPSLVRFVALDLSHALSVHRRLFWASTLVVASGCGFVAGLWPAWMVTVVVAFAGWATWGTLIDTVRSRERQASLTT